LGGELRTINIHQAKTHLSRLVDEAVEGDSFIIAKAGKPKVLVTRLDAPEAPTKRRLGLLEGMYTIPDNFEEIDKELDKEIEALMLGENEDEE
jgi:prevent-host-death family protein